MTFLMNDFTMDYYRKFKPYPADRIMSGAASARSSTAPTANSSSSKDGAQSARGV